MKDWLLTGAGETNEKIATELAGPGYYINRGNRLVLESKARMQKRGQASPDDRDALALTFAQAVAQAEKEERDEDDEFGGMASTAPERGCDELDPDDQAGYSRKAESLLVGMGIYQQLYL
jgi:hypothetical protein